jgi:hypothetical protein
MMDKAKIMSIKAAWGKKENSENRNRKEPGVITFGNVLKR